MTEPSVTIHPVLQYADVDGAIRFLCDAFGFTEHAVHRGPDGEIAYAELELGGSYLGFGPTHGAESPFELGPACVYVALSDPDAHHDRAVASGAEIVMELTNQDYGSRDYAARDPEGNVWCFGTYRPGQT
jgi:uncharacterized glyoxalase superfamily protein PhnB